MNRLYHLKRYAAVITNDFVMAVLSRSRSVEVIKPLHLRQRIHEILKQALDRNRVEDAGNDRGS